MTMTINVNKQGVLEINMDLDEYSLLGEYGVLNEKHDSPLDRKFGDDNEKIRVTAYIRKPECTMTQTYAFTQFSPEINRIIKQDESLR